VPIVVAVWAFTAIPRYLQVRKLRNRVLDIEPLEAYGGESIAVNFQYHPSTSVKIEYISAILSGQENVVSGSGSTRQAHTHPLYSEEKFMVKDVTTVPGLPASHRVDLTFPLKGAPTFVASANKIEWKVLFGIKLAGVRKWEETYPVTLWPTPGQEQFVPDDFDDDDDDDDDIDEVK
jgi:hypothetical protein